MAKCGKKRWIILNFQVALSSKWAANSSVQENKLVNPFFSFLCAGESAGGNSYLSLKRGHVQVHIKSLLLHSFYLMRCSMAVCK